MKQKTPNSLTRCIATKLTHKTKIYFLFQKQLERVIILIKYTAVKHKSHSEIMYKNLERKRVIASL